MGKQSCAGCHEALEAAYFSKTQREMPAALRRCRICVANGRPVNNRESGSARRNESSQAEFSDYDLHYPFAEGNFRWVSKGMYMNGPRKGQPCVCKWFKTGHVMEEEFFDLDIKAMEKALDLVKEWNSHRFIDKVVKVNIPQVWTFQPGSRWEGRKTLLEPFIENYQKFNSNTGWADSKTSWPQVMQALSHYSYHVSGGEFVLCDLQGGVYSNGVVLTDPVIISRTKQYGVTDLGPRGISSFFSSHRCNQYCRLHWRLPADRRRYHAVKKGTSMAGSTSKARSMKCVPVRHSLPALSAVAENY